MPSDRFRAAVIPYLAVKDGKRALEFYRDGFGAKTKRPMLDADGRVTHGEFCVSDLWFFLADEQPESGFASPETLGGSPVLLVLEVADADSFIERAAAAGGAVLQPAADQLYGRRTGLLRDPSGHTWMVSGPVRKRSAR